MGARRARGGTRRRVLRSRHHAGSDAGDEVLETGRGACNAKLSPPCSQRSELPALSSVLHARYYSLTRSPRRVCVCVCLWGCRRLRSGGGKSSLRTGAAQQHRSHSGSSTTRPRSGGGKSSLREGAAEQHRTYCGPSTTRPRSGGGKSSLRKGAGEQLPTTRVPLTPRDS